MMIRLTTQPLNIGFLNRLKIFDGGHYVHAAQGRNVAEGHEHHMLNHMISLSLTSSENRITTKAKAWLEFTVRHSFGSLTQQSKTTFFELIGQICHVLYGCLLPRVGGLLVGNDKVGQHLFVIVV